MGVSADNKYYEFRHMYVRRTGKGFEIGYEKKRESIGDNRIIEKRIS